MTDAELMFHQEAPARILRNLKMERGSCGRYMERSLFCEEMGILLRSAGYKRPQGEDRFSIKSLKSCDCLYRVWDFSRSMANGFAAWKSAMTEEGLENEPCHEFVSDRERGQLVWHEAGGKFLGPSGQMIAHKTDVIWLKMSEFGVPWTPFSFEDDPCDHLRGVGVDEAEELGVDLSADPNWQQRVWWDL